MSDLTPPDLLISPFFSVTLSQTMALPDHGGVLGSIQDSSRLLTNVKKTPDP